MEMAEEEALAEFRVNACLQSCIQYIIYHRKCSISYSTNEPFQMGPDFKKRSAEQIAEPQVLLFWLCLHTTFNPCA